jgi:hypothetical protein
MSNHDKPQDTKGRDEGNNLDKKREDESLPEIKKTPNTAPHKGEQHE